MNFMDMLPVDLLPAIWAKIYALQVTTRPRLSACCAPR